MKQIAQILLLDRHNRLLIYLRDNKPEIPFPNYWDFFGGHVEVAGHGPLDLSVASGSAEIQVSDRDVDAAALEANVNDSAVDLIHDVSPENV